jgi:hypothetical protein
MLNLRQGALHSTQGTHESFMRLTGLTLSQRNLYNAWDVLLSEQTSAWNERPPAGVTFAQAYIEGYTCD